MKDLFDSAYWLVHTGERCVLAMIRKSSGSTPRGQGAGMLVLEDGSMLLHHRRRLSGVVCSGNGTGCAEKWLRHRGAF